MGKRHASDKVNQPRRRHFRLINQGATCYLSSVLQVLFMTPELHDRLEWTSGILDQELRAVFRKLPEAPCGTGSITEALRIFNVHQQRDAAECLEMILKSVSHEASQVFRGQMKEMTRCAQGHVIVEETTPFLTLPLALQSGHDAECSVKASFHQLFHRTAHTGDNMVYCRKCSRKTEATSECEMVACPQVLILLLKRFDFDFNTMSDVKSNSCVDVPFTVQTEKKSYKLYGMVNHMGSLRGGHYNATVLSHDGDTWYTCDDTHVTEVDEQPFANNGKYSSSTAYLLMYRTSPSLSKKFSGEQEEPKDVRQIARGPAKTQRKPLMIGAIVFGCVVLALILFVIFCTKDNVCI